MEKSEFKNKLSDRIKIPKDVILGIPLLSVIGNEELYLGNFNAILEYNREIVRLRTNIGKIVIKGKQLQIEQYSNDDITIKGSIFVIEYQIGG